MSFSNKHNKVTHNVDTTGFQYVHLSALYEPKNPEKVTKLDWLYINSGGKYGSNPVFISVENKMLINIPSHLNSTVEEILKDSESAEMIKDGKVGYKIYTYESHNRTCYGVVFVDM